MPLLTEDREKQAARQRMVRTRTLPWITWCNSVLTSICRDSPSTNSRTVTCRSQQWLQGYRQYPLYCRSNILANALTRSYRQWPVTLQTLLLRNLDPLTKETDIARTLEILDEGTRARVAKGQGPRRIVLVKDKITNTSWCFAFAIYPDEECAKAAMRSILDPKLFPTGFNIQEKLVAVTFARTGCFTKAYAKTTWSFPEFSADGTRQEFIYWDDHAYGSIYDSPSYITAIERRKEEEAKMSDVDAFFSSLEGQQTKPSTDDEVVKPPPAFSIGLAGTLYAPCAFHVVHLISVFLVTAADSSQFERLAVGPIKVCMQWLSFIVLAKFEARHADMPRSDRKREEKAH